MENVDEFVGQLRGRLSELGFKRTVAFLDENFAASEKYEKSVLHFFFFLIDFGSVPGLLLWVASTFCTTALSTCKSTIFK